MKTKAEKTRQQILEKAGILIQVKGFQATSLGDIITAAGITKGGFYHHFLNKDELGFEIIEQARVEFMAFLDQILASDTPKKSLLNFLDAVLIKHQQTEFIGGCIFGNIALEMADKGDLYTIAVTKVFDEWSDKLEKIIIGAQNADQISANISAPALANLMVTTIEGGIMLSRLKKVQQPLHNCLESLKEIMFKQES
jgi:TetR/AcrR family transcriptional regulator, transcriptional repressor for nem operon